METNPLAEPPDVDSIQSKAIELGYSSQGEMFSVDYMEKLAETFKDDLTMATNEEEEEEEEVVPETPPDLDLSIHCSGDLINLDR